MERKPAQKTVGDYVSLQRGTTYSGSLVGQPGPVLLGLGSIVPGGGFRADHFKTFGGECPAKLMLKPGDLYVALKGATKDGSMVGSIARLPHDIKSGRLTQDTARLDFFEKNPEIVAHIYWTLRTPEYRKYCDNCVTGSASASFSREDFLRYPIRPLTATTKALVAVLDAVELQSELNRQISDTLEQTARAIFQSWFVDFDPVNAKAKGIRPDGLDAEAAKLFPDKFENSSLGLVPKGWKIVSLGDHVEVAKGLSYKGEGLAESGMTLHNLNSVYEGGGYKYEGVKHYVGEYRPSHIIRAGDVIVTNTEQGHDHLLIGYSALIPKRYGDLGLFSHHTYRLRPLPHSPLTPQFIHYLLLTSRFRSEVTAYTNGTTVNMLPAEGLKRPRLVLPPAELIRRFTEFVTPLIDKAEANYEESRSLTVTRDALLPKLLSGEVSPN
jgi:type I restriction enzyme S subunit